MDKLKDNKLTKVPVLFQTLKEFKMEDTRFTEVKIWLMHLGENYNGSYFDKDVVEEAIPTLGNTPIMGFLNQETSDFEGHEVELLIEGDEVEFKNLTIPYGVIPETNEAQFEDRVGDDGVTRTYLTVKGLLWNKWEDAVDNITRKGGTTGQSMELAPEYSGRFDDSGYFHFTNFKFDGACLLGDEVLPAMNSSTVEISFSDKVGKIIQEKLEVYSRSIEEGGKEVDLENNVDEVVETEETTFNDTEEKDEVEEVVEAEETEQDEVEETKEFEQDENETESNDSEEDSSDEQEEVKEEELTIEGYTLTEVKDIIKNYETLVEENRQREIDNLIGKYSDNLTEEEVTELKEKSSTLTNEQLEIAIFAALGRKSFSSKKQEKKDTKAVYSSVSIADTDLKNSDPYGGVLDKYFK